MARLSRSLRCLAAVLAWRSVWATSTTGRVAIPDLAGMLYPQQTQRIERFGTALYAATSFYASMESASEFPLCEDSDALCLEVVWTSEYESDPFVLTAFESKLDVRSRTFDDVAPTAAASVSPVVEGNANTNVSSSRRQTLWRFHVPMNASSIDLLFRMRQQSQRRAVRDQLLLHVVATRVDHQSNTAALETYSIYGNQYVENMVRRVANNQLRLDVGIRRNASRSDVVFTDAYPLVPVDTLYNASNGSAGHTWRIIDSVCLQCTALLLGCEDAEDVNRGGECSFESTTTPLPACLRSSFNLTASAFKDMLTNNQDIPMHDALTQCFANLLIQQRAENRVYEPPQWWNASRALGCLASRHCPFGPLNGVLNDSSEESPMVQLGHVQSSVFNLTWDDDDFFSGFFEITFGAGVVGTDNNSAAEVVWSASINDTSSVSTIQAAMRSALPPFHDIDVNATKSYDANDRRWSVRVEISKFVFPNLWIHFVDTSRQSHNESLSYNESFRSSFQAGGSAALQIVAFNSSQLARSTPCDECGRELEPCQDDDVCRQLVLPCWINTLEALNASNVDVDPVFGTYRISFFDAIEAACLRGVAAASWHPIRRAMLCASRYQCALDDTNTTRTDEWTFVGFTDGIQRLAVPLESIGDDGKSIVALNISYPPGAPPLSFHSSTDKLASFVELFVLQSTGDVAVDVERSTVDPARMVELRVVYVDAMAASNPVFNGTQELHVLDNVAPRVFFEVGDLTTFSLETLLSIMRIYTNARADPFMGSYAWQLAPECEACNAQFFGCSVDDVRHHTCTYETAASALGQCIHAAVPRTALSDLVGESRNVSFGAARLLVTDDITHCVQTTAALLSPNATMDVQLQATAAVSCYATTQCPFGPVDMVENDRMVQLVASTYVHTLRVQAASFQLQLVFSMGSYEITSTTIRNTDPNVDKLRAVLAPFGIRVGLCELDCDAGECTITIRYTNIVVSDFSVRVGQLSVPQAAVVEQTVLRSTARLVVMPRIAAKVFMPFDGGNATNSTQPQGPWVNPSSSSGGWDSSMHTSFQPNQPNPVLSRERQCALCDTIHLTACERSAACRTQFAPIVVGILNTSMEGSDVAAMLRDGLSNPFFDWWEPLQRWLVCYARNHCPTSTRGDSYLALAPATINMTDVWRTAMQPFELVVEAPPGSSLFPQSVVVANLTDLTTRLFDMTQGISTVTSVTDSEYGMRYILSLQFLGPFPGKLPTGTAVDGSDLRLVKSPARLSATSNTHEIAPLNALALKLAAVAASTLPLVACSDCAAAYLSACRARANCAGYLLECLFNSMDEALGELADMDLVQAFSSCSRDLDKRDWLPVSQYLQCLGDSQCAVSDDPFNYVRFQVASLQIGLMDGFLAPAMAVTVDGVTSTMAGGSYDVYRDVIQRAMGNDTTIEIVVRSQATQPPVAIDVYLYGPSATQIDIVSTYTSTTRTARGIVVYSIGGATRNASIIASAFQAYMTPWTLRTAPCVGHLDDCVRSDSVNSLVCRYRYLPQLYAGITTEASTLGYTSLSSGDAIELGGFLRGRLFSQATTKQAAVFLAQYLLCVANTSQPLNKPHSGSPRVVLQFTPGQQLINVPTLDHLVRIVSPQGIQQYAQESYVNFRDNPALAIAANVLGIHDAPIQVTLQSNSWDTGVDVELVYGNYLGFLPVFDRMRWEQLPSLAFTTSDASNRSWSRLSDTLAFYAHASGSASAADGACSSCNALLASTDPTLAMCIIRQLRDLSFGASFGIFDCASNQPAATNTTWLPLAQFCQCMITNGCDLRTGTKGVDDYAVYMGTRAGHVQVDMDFDDGIVRPSSVQLVYPRLPGMTDAPAIVSATVDRNDNYRALIDAVNASLDKNGQVPSIRLNESIAHPNGDSLVRVSLTLTISDFVGYLPSSVGGNATVTLSSYVFVNVNNLYTEPPGQSLSALIKKIVWGTAPPVLTASCAQYGAALYGCSTADIASRVCSYNSATSVFGSCLRDQLPQDWFLQSLLPAAVLDADSPLTSCFGRAIDADTATPPASFQDDQWYQAANAMAHFEQMRCPFGPLEVALAQLKTIHVQSAARTLDATIAAASFQAIFRLRVGFRVLESSAFTDNADNDALTALLAAILPARCQPNVVAYGTGTSFVVSIQLQYWYLASSVYTLEIDAGAAGLVTALDSSQMMTALVVDDANMTFLAFDNSSTGGNTSNTSTTPAPTSYAVPTAAPLPVLSFTTHCEQCDAIHLAACERSTYCRTQAAPIVRSSVTPSSGSDLAALIRTAVADTFVDRWEPLQRWLVCYAKNRCPTSPPVNGRTGDSYLELSHATLNLTDVWSQMQSPPPLSVFAPVGTSLHDQSVTISSREELLEYLAAMTHGISNATCAVDLDNASTLFITYTGPYLGELPVVTAIDASDIGFLKAAASIYVKSTSSSAMLSVDLLTSKLTSVVDSTTPMISCNDCANVALAACQQRSNCKAYLLECLLHSMPEYLNTEFDLSDTFTGCSSGLNSLDWLPVVEYLTCLRDHQCAVDTDYSVFARLETAGVQLVYDTTLPYYLTSMEVPGVEAILLNSTLEELRDEVQRAFNTSAKVEMDLLADASQGKTRVNLWYHDLTRDPIRLSPQAGYGILTPTRVALYAASGTPRRASVITADLTRFMAPWNNRTAPCTNYLDACVRSDSVDSLVCRYLYLPQLLATVSTDAALLSTSSLDDGRAAGLELVPLLHSRLFSDASTKRAALFLSRYLLCLANAAWPLQRPSSQPPMSILRFRPGQQSLTTSIGVPFTLSSPTGIETNTQTMNATSDSARTIANDLLGIADADITVSISQGDDVDLNISYQNYLGYLPIVDAGSVLSIGSERAPSLVLTPADASARPWTRLIESLTEYARANVDIDLCGTCPSFLDSVDTSLALCILRTLRNFVSTTGYSIYDCVHVHAVGTTWLPLAQYLQCLITNSCNLKTGTSEANDNAVFMGTSPGRSQLSIDFSDGVVAASNVPLTYPQQPGATGSPPLVSVVVSRDENYTSLLQAVDASLEKTGQTPVLHVTEAITAPYGGTMVRLELNVTVSTFYGFLPSLGTNAVTLSTLLFTNVTNAYSEPPATSLSYLMQRSLWGTSAPVLRGACLPYAAALYGCTEAAISSGNCTYSSAPAWFPTCLRSRLPPSWFSTLLPPVNQQSIDQDLTYCFTNAVVNDQTVNAASYRDDTWYQVAHALALWEQTECPFGPLELASSKLQLVRLLSATRTLQATVEAATFEAVFRMRVGFRVMETDLFSQDATSDDLQVLLATILPTPPTVTVAANGSSVAITVELLYWYLDSTVFTLEIDAGADGLVTATDSGLLTRLHIYDMDTTFLAFNK